MKIVLLTPGTGSYHCGVCMRDNSLAKELIRQGHDAMMLPMYLPLTLDEPAANPNAPVFFGGISVFLQQKFALFRHTPRWFDRLLNAGPLLKLAGRFSGMTATAEVGELTHSMLLGEHGHQAKEIEALIAWLLEHGKPDSVWLSTALFVGLARRIKESLGVPVLASLQGEDSFLDGLPEPERAKCWAMLAERARDVDVFVSPSRYYADFMGGRMKLGTEKLRVIPNGIAPGDFVRRTELPTSPRIGFLSRFIEGKGFGLVVDAFIELRKRGRFPNAKLRCAGTMIPADERNVTRARKKLADAGLAAEAEFSPNVTREEKVEFLRSLTLLSVPATYGEAFGMYLIEAMAAGVPIVQPRTAAFTEIVEASSAGILCEPGSATALADAWEVLLGDPARLHALGERGRTAAEGEFSLARMTERFVAETEALRAIPSTPSGAAV